MHIAFYSPSWPAAGAANGIITYVDAMREELLRRGHQVSIVTLQGVFAAGAGAPQPPGPKSVGNLALSLWDRFASDTASAADRLKQIFADLHRRQPIDIIEMEESFGWVHEVASLGIPVVTRLHGPQFRQVKNADLSVEDRWMRNRMRRERRALSAAAALSSPAKATLDDTCDYYGCAAQLREVIVNPVRLSPPEEAWSLAGSDPDRLLWVGQFTLPKGADLLLGAFEQVAAERPDLQLDIVGPDRGVQLDGEVLHFADYCERFVNPAVRERIRMHGLLRPEEIAPMRRRAGLTLITSRSEVFPYVVAEAMAAGSPILSTRWGGESEMIVHGRSGWIADENSIDALARTLREALSAPPAVREACAKGGWSFCEAHLAQRPVVDRTLSFYQSAIEAHGRRGS